LVKFYAQDILVYPYMEKRYGYSHDGGEMNALFRI
jgi:hypothetical protein